MANEASARAGVPIKGSSSYGRLAELISWAVGLVIQQSRVINRFFRASDGEAH